ncbi:MAG: transporter [Leptolyngbyaceae cyanobacterium CSU_1_3]|nr:transporter [Leptolyngbyaceae cyanobacterium CSU_1_3]
MAWVLSSGLTGIAVFVATNIDDLVILMLFFAQVNSTFCRRDIFVGQYVGFMAIVFLSLPGFWGGLLISKPVIGLLGFVPIGLGICTLIDSKSDNNELQTVNPLSNFKNQKRRIDRLVSPQILSVAAVTLANGGDNIGIYISLFASQTFASLGIILSVFFVCVGLWCLVADCLAKHQAIALFLTSHSRVLAPIVLIGLGVYILAENQSWRLISGLSS